jgi:hypothetical protein
MRRSGVRGLAVAALLMATFAGCGSNDISEPVVDPGVTAGGLNFTVLGAGYSTASGTLPAPAAAVAAPVVTLTGSLGGLATASLAVSAAEPFQTVLLLPVGAPAYARVVMPGNATLISIATTRVSTSSFIAQQLQVAIVRGGRVSAPVTISLLTPVN